MNSHRNGCKCVKCKGIDPLRKVEITIKQNGFAVLSIDDGKKVFHSLGLSGGEKGGYEFVVCGLSHNVAVTFFNKLRKASDFAKSMLKQAESQDSDIVVFNNVIEYASQTGASGKGPMTVVKITEKNRQRFLEGHQKYYHHTDFSMWQILTCDMEGNAAFDEGYDVKLMDSQPAMFDVN